MDGLVDYAGLFPPASLDIRAAVAEFARHQTEPEAWMLGRFIAPAGRLEEIGDACSGYLEQGGRWAFSVLAGHRDDPDAALKILAAQGRAVGALEDRFAGAARVEVLEIPLPAVVTGAEVSGFLGDLAAHLRSADLAGRQLFVEIPTGGDDRTVLAAVGKLAADQAGPKNYFPLIGAKLRCGGVTPEAFPSSERVAAFIDQCRRLELPLKCTAGLHHPVRHLASEPPVMMHGFLNVFGAGMLAHAGAPLAVLTGCLAETDPVAFSFTATGFGWRDHTVDVAAMSRARRTFLNGFGSCSFAEPREDLRTLGLL